MPEIARKPGRTRIRGRRCAPALALALAATATPAPGNAADRVTVLAEMAERARAACEAKGFPVTVSIVGTDGQPVVVLRSDGAPIHTVLNSFDKAYTIMTLGPLKHIESGAALATAYEHRPAVSYDIPQDHLPHIVFSAGAVLLKMDGRLVGGLGVSGSDGGDIDEGCARVGIGDAH